MSANTLGHIFKCHSFGESHGVALGVIVEGCPAGLALSVEDLKQELKRRRPGDSSLTSKRKEPDDPEILSGVVQGKTLGTPICIIVRNQDARSEDYKFLKEKFREGHADDLWQKKFQHSDLRGGGRASGRETVSRVLAGGIAKVLLKSLQPSVKIQGFVRKVGRYFYR